MSEDAVPPGRAAAEHSVTVPGGTIYYRTQGCGPPLVLIGGGPSNADTLDALAARLGRAREPGVSPTPCGDGHDAE
jgi:hypothetical protein